MEKKENYYEIEKKIYNILQRIENATIENAYDIYTEGQCLIFEYDYFKKYYIDKTREVLNDIKSGKYKNIIIDNYNAVKAYSKEYLKNKNVKISFTDERKCYDTITKHEYELSASKFPYPVYSFVQEERTI